MVLVSDWLDTIRRYDGTPTRHRGMSKKTGVDCSGLIIGSLGEHGITIDRPFLNGTLPLESQVTSAMEIFADRTEMLLPGIIIQTLLGKQGRHLGVCIGENSEGRHLWMHAKGSRGKVVTTIFTGAIVNLWKPHGVEF